MERMSVNILIGGAALYGLLVGGIYLMQDSMIFPRGAAGIASYPVPPTAERLELVTRDGVRLAGYLVPAREPSRGLLLGFAGNAWNGDDFTAFLAHRVKDHDIVVFHYRGYAPSEGRPSEAALFEDALLIYDRMAERLRPTRVVGAGFSLGSGVAAYLARHRRVDGLLLVTPFASLEAVARERYPWLPVRALIRHAFRSDVYLRDLDVPAAVIMAGDDRVIPKTHGEALVQVLTRPVMVETVPDATHNGLYDEEAFDVLLERALRTLAEAGRGRLPERSRAEDGIAPDAAGDGSAFEPA